MIKNTLLLLFFLPIIYLTACKGSKKSMSENTEESINKTAVELMPMDLMIKKSNCFGRCPVFELDVMADGSMEYRGKMFVDKTGVWKGQMASDQLLEIQQMVKAAQVYALEDQYLSGATDFPMHILKVTEEDKTKSIKGDFALPKSVKTIIAQIDSVANLAEWVQYAAVFPHDAIPGEILVKMKSESTRDLEKAFEAYGLSQKKKIAPNMTMYTMSFPHEEVDAGRLLVLIRQHEQVEMAQFNQKVSDRQ